MNTGTKTNEGAVCDISEICPGIFRIPLPMKGDRPGPVNTYLFTGCPVTLLDTGVALTADILEASLRKTGYSFSDIERIVITHGHIDHYGAAAIIQERAGKHIPVFAHRADAPNIRQEEVVPWKQVDRFYRMAGVPFRYRRAIASIRKRFRTLAARCDVDQYLEEGMEIACGRYTGTIVETPGHSKGAVCVYIDTLKALFSGDHLLAHITPNAFVMLEKGSPLPSRLSQAEFFSSLDRIAALKPSMVYPGHGREISEHGAVIAMYRKNFEERQKRILEILGTSRMTPYGIAKKLFPDFRGKRLMRELFLIISEVYSHLQVLEKEGRVTSGRMFRVLKFHVR
ncbi:MAG TPA: MBL fold metallo-hydrolase [Spirochaetota bacterium]|nr:MBL fold metallo-hydrolase [Spirochaetota bacterium]